MENSNSKGFYTYLQSQETAQRFLLYSYQHLGVTDPEVKSYENCPAFLAYLKHGLHFYNIGEKSTMIIKPILLFYGMIHLIKATLLTKRPHYPESTKLLAHGVSSRKRKKRNYTFFNDEVTIHHHGLYTYFSKYLYQVPQSLPNKFKMKDLFSLIPELFHLFRFNQQTHMQVVGKVHKRLLIFDSLLLDHYHLTSEAFLKRIKLQLPSIDHINMNVNNIEITLNNPLSKSFGPFFFHTIEQNIYFPMKRENFLPISEIMVHYLLLYNLSMISRYHAEWWEELLSMPSDLDFPLIKQFLYHSAYKVPLLLEQELYHDYLTWTTHEMKNQ